MRNSCAGFVFGTAPDLTLPGCLGQVNGVDVATGVFVSVAAGMDVDVGGRIVGVGMGWFDGEQAESPKRSEKIKMMRR